jgi:hypothetical protein
MTTTTQQRQNVGSKSFPSSEVEARLRREFGKVAAESDVLRGSWEPSLDSLRIVAVLPKLADLFDFDLRPERIVRKGGYHSVDEGVESVRDCLQRLWQEHCAKREVS